MRLRLLFPSIAIAFSQAIINNSPVIASGPKFYCGSWDGVPATIAKTKNGEVPVIRWVSQHFADSGFDTQKRCEIVSAKFQEYHKAGTLKYLTTGRSNGQNIVCVAQEENGACSGQLFTLRPGSNPGHTLTRLMSIRYLNSGPLNESSERIYINMNDYLQEAEQLEQENTNINNPNRLQVPISNPENIDDSPSSTETETAW